MRGHIPLGRILGVHVSVNVSVLLIFALITLGLAGGRFPDRYPGLGDGAYIAAGLAAGAVFFLSLLAHELAHSVTAKRNGIEVEGITLWLFGGVARLSGEADSPGADLRIAAVGPLTSLVLAAVFFVVRVVVDAARGSGLVVGVFDWLAFINLVLALFNLIPGAPLDGGRILRAVLWLRSGDRTDATVKAARAGRAFGWLLVALGVADLFTGAGFGGLWIALIGWFITTAAAAEEQHAVVSSRLAGVRARDVMTRDPVVVAPDLTVDEFLATHILGTRYSSFPLVDDEGRPVGLVTLQRVKQVPPQRRAVVTVAEIACGRADLSVVEADEPMDDVVTAMTGCADGRTLVVDHERLVGIISPSDVVRHLEISELRRDREPA